METKLCKDCEETKPLDEYYVHKYKSGTVSAYVRCKTCHKAYVTRHARNAGKQKRQRHVKAYTSRRRKILHEIKTVPCADCGGEFPPYVMDFDHRDPEEKSFTIAEALNRVGLEKLLEEVEKCDVVCANCHRIRTYSERYDAE